MTRVILLAGNESSLSRAIENEAAKRVEQFAAAYIPNRLAGAPKSSSIVNDKRVSFDWNPSSPLSSRTLVISTQNKFNKIDEAILICSPPSIRCNAADISLTDVEVLINDHIKSWFFLVKELAVVFRKKGSGTLVFVYHDSPASGKDESADILGASAAASFRAMCHELLATAHIEPYFTIGFSAADAGNDALFASFIFKNIDELNKRSNGKLFKFGKFNIFR